LRAMMVVLSRKCFKDGILTSTGMSWHNWQCHVYLPKACHGKNLKTVLSSTFGIACPPVLTAEKNVAQHG
jgi:hypothetical protein